MSMAKFKALTRLGYGCEPIKHLLVFILDILSLSPKDFNF